MILFGLKCSRDPKSMIEGGFEQLRKHGLKQSEIIEVIAMSAFAVMRRWRYTRSRAT